MFNMRYFVAVLIWRGGGNSLLFYLYSPRYEHKVPDYANQGTYLFNSEPIWDQAQIYIILICNAQTQWWHRAQITKMSIIIDSELFGTGPRVFKIQYLMVDMVYIHLNLVGPVPK